MGYTDDQLPAPASLAGRHILVTGAASGIGAAVVRLFRRQGAAVAGMDRDKGPLEAACAAAGAVAVTADVTDAAQVNDAVGHAATTLGGLDGVVNAAGIAFHIPLAEMEPESWARMLAVNLTGPYLVCRAALPFLRGAAGASIVNIASGAGLLPTGPNGSAYAASKGGLIAFSKALAVELAPDIRVNALCPGLTETPMTQGFATIAAERYALKRAADPAEIARAILFLTSMDAAYVTGATLAVDGGRTFH